MEPAMDKYDLRGRPMPTTPKDIHSLDYSDVDSLADFVCDAMFLDKSQHKEFFFHLFDKCRDQAYEDGSKDTRYVVYDRDQVEKQSIAEMREERESTFCSLPSLSYTSDDEKIKNAPTHYTGETENYLKY